MVNANNDRLTYAYDTVGNVTTVVDPRKNATADPNDYTNRLGYDLAHRVTRVTDALDKFTTSTYDHDGLVTARTDEVRS